MKAFSWLDRESLNRLMATPGFPEELKEEIRKQRIAEGRDPDSGE